MGCTIQIMLRDTENGLVDVETTVTGYDKDSNALALADRINGFMAEIAEKHVKAEPKLVLVGR
ncbi:MAG: hypothetical protein V4772_08585 [Pseudomonadota bacterium]